MDHDYLARLKQTHPALRLLNADNAPLIISFLFRIFIEPNRRSLPHSELVARLDDYLAHLRAVHGEARYPGAAREYLEDGVRPQILLKFRFLLNQHTYAGSTPLPMSQCETPFARGASSRPG